MLDVCSRDLLLSLSLSSIFLLHLCITQPNLLYLYRSTGETVPQYRNSRDEVFNDRGNYFGVVAV